MYGAGGGKLFVFDPVAAKVVKTIDLAVSAMTLAPGGEIVGTGKGRVFAFAPSQGKLIHTADNPLGDFTHMCADETGRLFGINARHVARILAGSWQVQPVAAEGGRFLAADRFGQLYFARGSHVHRLRLNGDSW